MELTPPSTPPAIPSAPPSIPSTPPSTPPSIPPTPLSTPLSIPPTPTTPSPQVSDDKGGVGGAEDMSLGSDPESPFETRLSDALDALGILGRRRDKLVLFFGRLSNEVCISVLLLWFVVVSLVGG
jgi:hypothetical protein